MEAAIQFLAVQRAVYSGWRLDVRFNLVVKQVLDVRSKPVRRVRQLAPWGWWGGWLALAAGGWKVVA